MRERVYKLWCDLCYHGTGRKVEATERLEIKGLLVHRRTVQRDVCPQHYESLTGGRASYKPASAPTHVATGLHPPVETETVSDGGRRRASPKQMLAQRAQGVSWADIAARFGYKNARSAQATLRTYEKNAASGKGPRRTAEGSVRAIEALLAENLDWATIAERLGYKNAKSARGSWQAHQRWLARQRGQGPPPRARRAKSDRVARAREMRAQGATYQEITTALGYRSHGGAYNAVRGVTPGPRPPDSRAVVAAAAVRVSRNPGGKGVPKSAAAKVRRTCPECGYVTHWAPGLSRHRFSKHGVRTVTQRAERQAERQAS